MKEMLRTEKEIVFLLSYFHALLKVKILHGCFSRFLNCTNGKNDATYHIKLTASGEVILGKCSNKIICCVSSKPKAVNSFLTIQTKHEYVSAFCRLSQNTILESAVFKLLQFIQNIHKLHHIKM